MDLLTIAALGGMVVLLAVGVEIVAVLGVGTILLTLTQENFSLLNIGMSSFSAINLFPILAVPLFILTGDLVSEAGISRRLIVFSRAVVGWIHGGMVMTAILAAGFFAAISGSNAATVAAIGRIMIPDMKADKFPSDFAAASMACGGTVGIIIPPSIVFVIYGVATGAPIGDLFLAGIIPGILMMVAMGVTAFVICRRRGWGESRHDTGINRGDLPRRVHGRLAVLLTDLGSDAVRISSQSDAHAGATAAGVSRGREFRAGGCLSATEEFRYRVTYHTH